MELAVGCFGHIKNLWTVLVRAVLLFMGRFRTDPSVVNNPWAVLDLAKGCFGHVNGPLKAWHSMGYQRLGRTEILLPPNVVRCLLPPLSHPFLPLPALCIIKGLFWTHQKFMDYFGQGCFVVHGPFSNRPVRHCSSSIEG